MYIGGILGVGARDFAEDEATFKKIGFDRVYPPESDVKQSIRDLVSDLKARNKI
jgi:methylmalonyl-CoA mutase cobalamin-binding subunit